MCRGGGGNKSRLCTKEKKKYNLHFTFYPPPIFENILSVPHVIFFSCIFNLRHAKNTWQVRGVVALR